MLRQHCKVFGGESVRALEPFFYNDVQKEYLVEWIGESGDGGGVVTRKNKNHDVRDSWG